MKYFLSFLIFSSILSLNLTLNAASISDTKEQESFPENSNYLFNFINDHQYFSANFEQTTLQEKKKRLIKGEIKANREGIFKISYYEPLNEVMFSDGKDFYRFDLELEQLNILPLEDLLKETPVGLFTLDLEEIKELFTFEECQKN